MNIQAEKLELIRWIAELDDPTVIKGLIALRQNEQTDWWNTISDEERAHIEEGLVQAGRGEVIPHKEVMQRMREKYGLSD